MPGTTYKSMEVYDGTPSGAGGQALDNNFVAITDRIGSYIENASDPDANDDDQDTGSNGVAYQNSLWLNTTDKTLWLCIDATVTAAVWKHINQVDIVLDTTPQLGGSLDVNGQALVSTSDGDIALTPNGTGSVLLGGNVGIGTTEPSSILHIKANVPGTVGSHPAGQLIIQDPDDSVWGNAVITGYESDGAGNPDQQLWYLGSSSGSNSAIIFLNRRNASLSLGTNGSTKLTILGAGNIGAGTATPHYPLTVNGGIGGLEKSADPAEPAEGEYVIWMSDGTTAQTNVADGDVVIASKVGGTTKVTILHDHSTAGAWV